MAEGVTPEECDRRQDRLFTKLDDMQTMLADQHTDTVRRVTACETKIDDYMKQRDESGQREAEAVRRIGKIERAQSAVEAKLSSANGFIGHIITIALALLGMAGLKWGIK